MNHNNSPNAQTIADALSCGKSGCECHRPTATGSRITHCPTHDDEHPSLSIKDLTSGEVLLHCFAGCPPKAVIAALERKGLWPSTHEAKKIEAIYDYKDADGHLLFQTVRFVPKDFAQRRPDGAGGFIWNLRGIQPVLYRLPQTLAAAKAGNPVFVVEGEKDVDSLFKLGLTATCNPLGAGKWNAAYSESLSGAHIIIIPDKDSPGKAHADQVARSLCGKAASIKTVELPGDRVKDVSDWLALGGSREGLERLVAGAPSSAAASPSTGYCLTRLSDLLREPTDEVAYVWDATLVRGGLSILAAKPKVGKSTLARSLALAVARGDDAFLGRKITAAGPVVYLALEEKRSEVKAHFERMGADGDLPVFVHCGSAPEKAVEELGRAVREQKTVLAIVDPLQRLMRLPDINDYSAVSLALEPLMQLARGTGCHILLVHHEGKGLNREGGDAILGSTALFASVDTALSMRRCESCRTIESRQRYGDDIPRTVLVFDPTSGLTTAAGTVEEAESRKVEEAILELLADHEEKTESTIREALSGNTGLTGKALRRLCEEGRVHRDGAGKRGNPYRYILVSRFPDIGKQQEREKQETVVSKTGVMEVI